MQAIERVSLKTIVAVVAAAVVMGAIGVVVSAQMAPRRGTGADQGYAGAGMMGQRPATRGGQGPGMRGGPGGGPIGMMGPALRGLNLTDAQREQVRTIMESHKDEQRAIGDRMRTARTALGDAITGDVVNEDAIRARAAEVGAVEADAAVLQAQVHAEVFAVLTPEQQQKAKELRGTMRNRTRSGREGVRQRIAPRVAPRVEPSARQLPSEPETV